MLIAVLLSRHDVEFPPERIISHLFNPCLILGEKGQLLLHNQVVVSRGFWLFAVLEFALIEVFLAD